MNPYSDQHLFDVEWLADEIDSAEFEELDNKIVVIDAREHDGWKSNVRFAPLLQDLGTEHPRHEVIEQGQIEVSVDPGLACGNTILDSSHVIPSGLERPR